MYTTQIQLLQHKNTNYLSQTAFLQTIKGLNLAVFSGSFNPPHQGHLHIANNAIKYLNLDMLLWFVTPINPFKKNQQSNMLPLQERLNLSKELTKHCFKIKVSAFEDSFTTNYTQLIIEKLLQISQNCNLTYIMGEDNFSNLHKFYNWQKLIQSVNIAVFARSNSDSTYANSSAGSLLKNWSFSYKNLQNPYFSSNINNNESIKFYLIPKNSLSSTAIRSNVVK